MEEMNFASDFDESLLFGVVWNLHCFMGKKYDVAVSADDLNNFIPWEEYFDISREEVILTEGEFYRSKTYKHMVLDPTGLKVLWMIREHPKCRFGDIVTRRHKRHTWATELLSPKGLFRKKVHTNYQSKIENYDHFSEVKFYFEDSVQSACEVAVQYPESMVFIIRQPWNKIALDRYEYVPLPNVHVVNDWKEIGRKVENILSKA